MEFFRSCYMLIAFIFVNNTLLGHCIIFYGLKVIGNINGQLKEKSNKSCLFNVSVTVFYHFSSPKKKKGFKLVIIKLANCSNFQMLLYFRTLILKGIQSQLKNFDMRIYINFTLLMKWLDNIFYGIKLLSRNAFSKISEHIEECYH